MSADAGFEETSHLIEALDGCWRVGFTHLETAQHDALHALTRIYQTSPIGARLSAAVSDVLSGVFRVESFQVLAVARAGLQGAQYDSLSAQVRDFLGRPALPPAPAIPALESTSPLLSSAAHWLMDIAITGFGRLEPTTITAFDTTLAELQANPEHLRAAAMLTGFMETLLRPSDALFRWCDLWTRAMLTTFTPLTSPENGLVSGTLYPLGVTWRQHAQLVSFVVYAVLEQGEMPELVTLTQSAYRVEAIPPGQWWLLFPEAALLMQSLAGGKALAIQDMPCLAGGHLLWDASAASLSTSYKPLESAYRFFTPGASEGIRMNALPPEQRHPVHLAEPIALRGYQVTQEGERFYIAIQDHAFPLDPYSGLDPSIVSENDQLFGLLRYDAGEWYLHVMTTGKGKGKPIFAGKDSLKVLDKPPKDNTVHILKERASRLLREKA